MGTKLDNLKKALREQKSFPKEWTVDLSADNLTDDNLDYLPKPEKQARLTVKLNSNSLETKQG